MVRPIEVEQRLTLAFGGGEDLADEDGVVAAVVGGSDAAFEGGEAVVQHGDAVGAGPGDEVRDLVAGPGQETRAPLRQLLLPGAEDVDAEQTGLLEVLGR